MKQNVSQINGVTTINVDVNQWCKSIDVNQCWCKSMV